MVKKEKNKFINTLLLILVLSSIMAIIIITVNATPVGPTKTQIKNETRTIPTNTSINESTGGGYIYTYTFDSTEQNQRWKAYVGNVTGTLTLDDANSYTIYDWDLGTVTGEVYATRNDSTVSWANINCSNATHINNEELWLNHTNLDDNITATFDEQKHNSFYVGSELIDTNQCFSVHTYVNDANQSVDLKTKISAKERRQFEKQTTGQLRG